MGWGVGIFKSFFQLKKMIQLGTGSFGAIMFALVASYRKSFVLSLFHTHTHNHFFWGLREDLSRKATLSLVYL